MTSRVGDKLHFIVPCMGRLDQLKQTIDSAISQPNTTYTLVDYSCPQNTGDWVRANFPEANIVSVPNRERWHASEARNLGAATIPEGLLCFLDSDIVLSPNFSQTILTLVKPGSFLAPPPKGGICGLLICAKDDFIKAGGYDENMRGWGWEDIDTRMALERVGVEYVEVPESLIQHVEHGDELRTNNCDFQEKMFSNHINLLYGLIKEYLVRNNEPHDEATLRQLYRYSKERFLAGYPWLSWPDPDTPLRGPEPPVEYSQFPYRVFVDVFRTLGGVARGFERVIPSHWGGVRTFQIERAVGFGPILELQTAFTRQTVTLRAPGKTAITVTTLLGEISEIPVVDGKARIELIGESLFVSGSFDLVRDIQIDISPAPGPSLLVDLIPFEGYAGTVEVEITIGAQPPIRSTASINGDPVHLHIPVIPAALEHPEDVRVTVTGGGVYQQVMRRTTFLTAPKVTEEEAVRIAPPDRLYVFQVGGLKSWVDVIPNSYQGLNDLSAKVAWGWTDTALVCWITRTDDVLVDGSWDGDGVQLGVDPQNLKAHSALSQEFTLSWKDGETWVALDRSGAGLDIHGSVIHGIFARELRGNDQQMVVRLPFEILGIVPAAGRTIGISMMFPDNDGDGRKGWLEWGGGIGGGKSSRKYNEIILAE